MADSATVVVDRVHAELDVALRSALGQLDPWNRRIADYHLGFNDANGAPVANGGGKAIRATLAMLSAEAAGDRLGVGVPAAVGVELVHQYSLLHDDIIDEDVSRRHRPAAWTVFGTAKTILAGDALAALAIESVSRAGSTEATTLLATATRRMVSGQAADMAFEEMPIVPLADCLAMVADKTGALVECAASIGALAVGAPQTLVADLAAFGRHLGLAFQLVDDLIGLWGNADRTGKPVGTDIASRKKSLPVVAALAAGGAAAARLAGIYAQPGEFGADDIAAALASVEAAGGRAWAQQAADRETGAALRILNGMSIDDAARGDLRTLAAMLCARDH